MVPQLSLDLTLNEFPTAQCPPSCTSRVTETQTGPALGTDPAVFRKEIQFSASPSPLNQVSGVLLD